MCDLCLQMLVTICLKDLHCPERQTLSLSMSLCFLFFTFVCIKLKQYKGKPAFLNLFYG